MVWWVAAASIATSLGSGYESYRSGKKAEKKAEKRAERAAQMNYDLIMEETAEQVRRATAENQQKQGQFRAIIGASGVRATQGTPLSTYEALVNEQAAQVAWTKKAGKLRAETAREQSQYIGGQYMAQGRQGAYAGIGSALNIAAAEWG